MKDKVIKILNAEKHRHTPGVWRVTLSFVENFTEDLLDESDPVELATDLLERMQYEVIYIIQNKKKELRDLKTGGQP